MSNEKKLFQLDGEAHGMKKIKELRAKAKDNPMAKAEWYLCNISAELMNKSHGVNSAWPDHTDDSWMVLTKDQHGYKNSIEQIPLVEA